MSSLIPTHQDAVQPKRQSLSELVKKRKELSLLIQNIFDFIIKSENLRVGRLFDSKNKKIFKLEFNINLIGKVQATSDGRGGIDTAVITKQGLRPFTSTDLSDTFKEIIVAFSEYEELAEKYFEDFELGTVIERKTDEALSQARAKLREYEKESTDFKLKLEKLERDAGIHSKAVETFELEKLRQKEALTRKGYDKVPFKLWLIVSSLAIGFSLSLYTIVKFMQLGIISASDITRLFS